MAWEVLNPDALRKAPLVQEPYPYIIVDNLIRPEALPEVVGSFPYVPKRGSFPPEAVSYSGRFAKLMDEMHGPELLELLSERHSRSFNERASIVRKRRRSKPKNGSNQTYTHFKV